MIAQSLGLESKNQLLMQIIELSLLTLASFCKQESTSSSKIMLVERTALKMLVHLTITKPYVEKGSQIMTVKYF